MSAFLPMVDSRRTARKVRNVPHIRKSNLVDDRLNRRRTRQQEPDRCALTVLAFEINQPTQAVGDDIVDDVQAQADAAFVAARGEERIERLTATISTSSGPDSLTATQM